ASPPRRLWLLNRLDSGTSGVILVAASAELATSIRALFRQKHIKKTYHALVFGAPARASEVWRDHLAVQKKGGQIRTAAGGNIPSEARMQVLRAQRGGSPPLALIQLEPRTGRSHQLRVQCARRHLPIVGDATYGNFALNRDFTRRGGDKRLCLHSHHTEFSYQAGGQSHHFAATAPTPREFLQALGQG
ncbi:MAG: pseudouridine synthase, partial [Verrucomicrobiota bacterium]